MYELNEKTAEELWEESMELPLGAVHSVVVGAAGVIRWLTEHHPELLDEVEAVFEAHVQFALDKAGVEE
ncbi:hypothetical protein A5630_25275 [Mycolicibacterium mucogenicum]|uniref:Uncharacterized protein n=1 Tax=Mycolicibacterium mucogenicum TaxID=56689 RepID=A0A1A3GWR0_MYCMU|nr:hypothetical protein [Mycolicibacterium mucogenicum]OBJ40265.1 hypothetical protein A5630_25275 [Mycolicibacterium mucogenicum]